MSVRIQTGRPRLDVSSYELTRDGRRMKLERQPMELLIFLVERKGQLVTRSDIVAKLWGEGVFVDVDRSINSAIRKIRTALGDDSNQPQYLETVVGKGYRFIGDIELVGQQGTAHAMSTSLVSSGRKSGQTRRTLQFVAAAAIVIIAIGAFARARFRHPAPLAVRDSVLVADLDNSTHNPAFDDALNQALAIKLEESPFLTVVPQERVRETLKLMGHSTDTPLTRGLAGQVCQRDGIKAFVTGSVSGFADRYLVTLEALNCQNQESLAREQEEAVPQEKVLAALSKAASNLRQKLGESLSSIQKYDVPIEEASTPSLAALKAYSIGQARWASGQQLEAVPFYESAIEFDPKFALAYARLGAIYRNSGELDRAAQYQRKAFELRDRTSEPERLYITAHYYKDVTGELDKSIATYQVWAQTYPADWSPHNNLAVLFVELGRYDQAVEEGRKAVQLNPTHALPYNILGNAYVRMNRLIEARQTYQQALAQKLDFFSIHRGLYSIALMERDITAMEQETNWAKGKQEEFRMLSDQACAAGLAGQLKLSRTLSRQAIDQALHGGFKGPAAWVAARQALVEAAFGNRDQARARVAQGLAITRNQDALSGGAIALALSGDATGAQRLVSELDQRFRDEAWVQSAFLPTARAAIELDKNNSAGALRILQDGTPFELGLRTGFLTTYVRAEALLRAGRGKEASAEFQKIIDHRGVDPTSPLYAMAYLGSGRSLALAGDPTASRKSYQELDRLWKDADT